MAEIDQVSIVAGVPTTGNGEVPTLAPLTNAVGAAADAAVAAGAAGTLLAQMRRLTTDIGALSAEDFASQTTLAAILAKLIASPSTAANQSTIIGHVDGIEGLLTTLNAKDFGTQTTLASILAKIIAAPATEAKQDTALAGQAIIGTRTYGAALTRLAYTGTSAQSAAITGTEVLLHNCGAARCYVKAASSPTATANDIPLEPGEKFHMRITSGHKVAAIQDSAGGNLNIIPVA